MIANMPTPIQLVNGLVISVSEAKKILGPDAVGISDDELASLILSLSDFAFDLIKYKQFAN